MPRIQGQQFIFTRVEPAYSPTNYGGYQIAYHSPGLSTEVVSACENRVKSFHPPQPDLIRYQFFSIVDTVVVTHSKQIETVREINDRDMRSGIFLCHGLVFSRIDFEAIAENNPFFIFDHFRFLQDSQTFVRNYNHMEKQEVPGIVSGELRLPPQSGWLKETPKIVNLALHAQNLIHSKQLLLLLGTSEEILGSLQTFFHFIPLHERLGCSFDTHIPQVQAATGKFWAGGAPKYISGSKLIAHCKTHRIEEYPPGLKTAELYPIWLQNNIQNPPSQISALAPSIQKLSRAFQEKKPVHPDRVLEEAAISFYTQFRDKVFENIRSLYKDQVPSHIATSLCQHLIQNNQEKRFVLYYAALPRLHSEKLMKQVRNWFVEQAPSFSVLKRGDWEKLEKLAKKHKDPILAFWIAVHFKDQKTSQKALQVMDKQNFQEALDLFLKPFEPHFYVHQHHLNPLVNTLNQVRIPNAAFLNTIQAIIKAGGEAYLGPLAPQVASLDNKALTALEKATKKSRNLPQNFKNAIHRQRQLLGPPRTIVNSVRNMVSGDKSNRR
jgi:hypothetical protein